MPGVIKRPMIKAKKSLKRPKVPHAKVISKITIKREKIPMTSTRTKRPINIQIKPKKKVKSRVG